MSKPSAADVKKKAAVAAGKQGEKVPSLIIVTEEDDEFEEFEDADWDARVEEKDGQLKQQWQDDWDIDDADDDFCNQLRTELQKSK
ncbi:hypothetical protein P43SY_003669 [Pythium insidiosum]|uniref:26S proteasome complex subunit DSS1 n=1 Tax=Pythium insidiosum TaxID=114742 RepID=A0AAD5LV09_PYTIN|nr:hypothetical protein P43SY_003669 [Pythium insidiosum]